MSEKLVSIVIPVYNREKMIEKCIDSLVSQTYSNIEIIIVDDGSKDNSLGICENLAKKDPRIKVFHQENGGVSSARNYGLQNIHGEYVCFIDSDDYVEKDYVETLLSLLNENQADYCACRFMTQKKPNKKIVNRNVKTKIMSKEECLCEILSGKNFVGGVTCKIYKTSLIGGQLFDTSIHYGEDLLFNIEYLEKCKKTVYCSKMIYHYITYNESIVRSKFNVKKLSLLESLENIISICERNKYQAIVYARGWYAMINLELLYYIIRDKYKDIQLKKRLKKNIKNNLIYLKKGKLFPKYRKILIPIAYHILKLF